MKHSETVKKKYTVRDIAAIAGVSPTTVSRVLTGNGYVAENVRQMVEKTLKEYGYVYPKPGNKEKYAIGVVTGPTFEKEIMLSPFGLLGTSITQAVRRSGYQSTVLFSSDRQISSASLLDLLPAVRRQKVSGLIITGFMDKAPSRELKSTLHELAVPVVFIERASGCEEFNRVLVDNSVGIRQITEHLINAGHKAIAYVASPDEDSVEQARLSGFLKAVEGTDCKTMIFRQGFNDGIAGAGQAVMQKIIAEFPEGTAVVNMLDGYAAGELQYLQKHPEIHPPVITGHDDILAGYLSPVVSSVHLPYAQMAEEAVRIIEEENRTREYYARTVTITPRVTYRKQEDTEQ